ncbi:MAG: hypothetical protein PWR01_4212 [Clostridiales bacterium]|nr:hypothetical protein [Clostridiales bacterium]MDN5283139.1 hypothetical protein [Candidatus Ozemobacter sp.]
MKTRLVYLLAIFAVVTVFFGCAEAEELAGPVLGEPAPDFTLKDIDGNEISLSAFKDKFVVLEWVNYDCPFVKKHYNSGNMQNLQKKFIEEGVIWLTINSSAPGKQGNYPPEKWKTLAAERNSKPTAILLDEDGKVGKKYLAATTPHMFVIDKEGKLVYMGAIDDDPGHDPKGLATARNHVQQALTEVMSGKPVTTPITRPYGCSVKY